MAVSKQKPRKAVKTESAQEIASSNSLATNVPPTDKQRRSVEGLEAGGDRVMRSIYLDLKMLERLRDIARSTNRGLQEVMREGLTLVMAKYAKGSARE